jgi:hypothetical protein
MSDWEGRYRRYEKPKGLFTKGDRTGRSDSTKEQESEEENFIPGPDKKSELAAPPTYDIGGKNEDSPIAQKEKWYADLYTAFGCSKNFPVNFDFGKMLQFKPIGKDDLKAMEPHDGLRIYEGIVKDWTNFDKFREYMLRQERLYTETKKGNYYMFYHDQNPGMVYKFGRHDLPSRITMQTWARRLINYVNSVGIKIKNLKGETVKLEYNSVLILKQVKTTSAIPAHGLHKDDEETMMDTPILTIGVEGGATLRTVRGRIETRTEIKKGMAYVLEGQEISHQGIPTTDLRMVIQLRKMGDPGPTAVQKLSSLLKRRRESEEEERWDNPETGINTITVGIACMFR